MYPEKCLRGLKSCQPYGQIKSDLSIENGGSFYCCGKNDGTGLATPEDRYTLCFKGPLDDRRHNNDKRDLIHNASVLIQALAIIEET